MAPRLDPGTRLTRLDPKPPGWGSAQKPGIGTARSVHRLYEEWDMDDSGTLHEDEWDAAWDEVDEGGFEM